jgi:hypothetical protein
VDEGGELQDAHVLGVARQALETLDVRVDVRRRLAELLARQRRAHRPQALDRGGSRELRAEHPTDVEHPRVILRSAPPGQRP